MGKSLGVTILMSSDTDSLNLANSGEELLDRVLVRLEREVTAENSSGLTGARSGRIATSRVSREFNPDLSTIDLSLIESGESSSSLLVRLVFNESLTLTIKDLNLSERTMGLERSSVVSIYAKSKLF